MYLRYFLQSRHNRLIVIIFFYILPHAVLASMQKSDEDLTQLLNSIHTMQATFKQFIVSHNGVQRGQETEGTMVLERPGKFRWEVTKPNKQLIVVNKSDLLLYDVDLAQVTKRKMDYKKPGSPAMLLSGSTETLKQLFKISKLKSPKQQSWFELKPKMENATNNGYQWIRLCFVQGRLSKMRILDNFDQQSEIRFENVAINSKVSSDKFIFRIPPKVDVLDEG